MPSRGLSHLPVRKGMEAQVLNREIIPYLREVGAEVADIAPKLDQVVALLTQIEQNQGVPPGGTVFGFVGGITTSANANFASKVLVRGGHIFNLDGTNNLLVSTGTPSPSDPDTYTVRPGTLSPFLPCTDPSLLNMRSAAATVAACFAGS